MHPELCVLMFWLLLLPQFSSLYWNPSHLSRPDSVATISLDYLTPCQKKCFFSWMPIVHLYIHSVFILSENEYILLPCCLKSQHKGFWEHVKDIRKTWFTMATLRLTGWVTLGNILSLNYLTSFYHLKNVDNNSYFM